MKEYTLYVKIHNITGKKYLGYTSKNPYFYNGSGVYWTRHLKKYGYSISTHIILKTSSLQDIKEKGIFFSNLWNIVESPKWANLKEESGIGGSWKGLHGNSNPMFGTTRPDSVKQIISLKNKGKKNPKLSLLNVSRKGIPRSLETREKISKTKKEQSLKPMLGKTLTSEQIRKKKELKWYNDGNIEIMVKECPNGFVKGRLKRK